jgi:hypothetical protein
VTRPVLCQSHNQQQILFEDDNQKGNSKHNGNGKHNSNSSGKSNGDGSGGLASGLLGGAGEEDLFRVGGDDAVEGELAGVLAAELE